MKIWIHINGIQQGPYEKEEIAAMNLPAATPVWYEGLPQWIPACQAPELSDIFGAPAQPAAGDTAPAEEAVEAVCVEPAAEEQPQAAAAYAAASNPAAEVRRPATFLAWSILLTVCCCTPFSIAAIVTGAITNARYGRGDYQGARRMSHATEWLVIIAITLGIVGLPVSMLASLL
ncbi:MAG: CD225/dispanin family protein [Muribaculaceae bacterium]|nr:CD225/dispanin family protein [Muribaculaceae bacterium]